MLVICLFVCFLVGWYFLFVHITIWNSIIMAITASKTIRFGGEDSKFPLFSLYLPLLMQNCFCCLATKEIKQFRDV